MKRCLLLILPLLLLGTGCDFFGDGYDSPIGHSQTCYAQGYQLYKLQVYVKNGQNQIMPIDVDCKIALNAMLQAASK